MNDVELLRMAAHRIRDLASSVEQGQWIAKTNDRGHAWVNLPAYPLAWGMHGFVDEAKHVAPFASPAVALAVADWLDEAAGHLEEHIPAWTAPSRGVDDPPALAWNNPERLAALVEHHYGRALAVARAYLGVES